jgi:tetratricopeptide (TPR) repeat protein
VAGRRSVYERHLKAGHDYAWDGRWDKAIPEYRDALEEFPEDGAALSALAQAYVEAGEAFEAIDIYRLLVRISPNDPLPLRRLAELEEERGHTDAVVETYMALAEVYRKTEDLRQAVHAWEQVVRLAPDHIAARQRLAAAYVQLKAEDKAVAQHLAIADILHRMGQPEKAIQQCREALAVDPNNFGAHAMLEALRQGSQVQTAAEKGEPAQAMPETLTPAEETRQKALVELAGAVFEEAARPEEESRAGAEEGVSVEALISQALDFQTRGLVDDAIHSYLKVIRLGDQRPAVHFNLGLLFQQRMRFEEAIEQFQKSVRDPEYHLGSHFALGQCYRAQGQLDRALEQFLDVIKFVDLQTVGRDQADDLIRLYESLAESYGARGDTGRAKEFADSLVQFLSNKGWQDKVREARARLGGAVDGMTVSVAELLGSADADTVVKSLSLAREYLKRGLFRAASDECYRAIERAPWYLPAHLCLADIWLEAGDVAHATEKYRLVAETYQIRGEPHRAAAVYHRLLQVNPADTEARTARIELLRELGDFEQIVEESLAQMDMLSRLVQVDQAMKLAQETQTLIREHGLGERWQAAVLHQIGDIQMGRVEWKDALKTYRDIKALSPNDERARVRIVDLQYKLGQDREALAELDELIQLYRQRGEYQRAVAILRELADLRPQAPELHTRLAQAYEAMGAVPKAVEEWDVAARILWNAGHSNQAQALIRRIIGLNPDNVESYRTRLQQMGG